jgi:hypothetical protein
LDKAGDVAIYYVAGSASNPISVDTSNNKLIRKWPMCSKFFGNAILDLNLDHERIANWIMTYGNVGYIPPSGYPTTQDERTIDTGIDLTFITNRTGSDKSTVLSGNTTDDYIFFTTENDIGFSLLGSKTFTYSRNSSGQIEEHFDGAGQCAGKQLFADYRRRGQFENKARS